MIIVVATLIGMASAALRGGKLRRLAQIELRSLWLIWLTILVQTVIFELPPTIVSDQMYEYVHLGTYASAFVFLWLNRHIPGASIIGLGAGANAIAIAANDGVMPASPAAWRLAGFDAAALGDFENSNLTPNANFAILGDIFAIPASWPLTNVFSIGDIVIVLGGTYFAHAWCRRAHVSNAWPAPDPGAAIDAPVPIAA